MINEAKKHKNKKHCSSVTYTTGDPKFNMDFFNKHMGTDGYLSGTIDAQAVTQADTFLAASPDGANSVSTSGDCFGGGEASGGTSGGDGGAALEESKRYVRRYYARPMNRFASNKAEIIRILIDADKKGQNCSIYTLNNLKDNNDITKLTSDDIIYYYDDGILYDKNHVKVMDYDLMVKHEEKRDNLNPDQVSNKKFADNYDDRITELTGEDKEVLTEDSLYATKLGVEIELPKHIGLLDKNYVESFVSKLEPEEEFVVGYVTPMYFYKQLTDMFTLIKCTELIGTTGVDYIEADAEDANKQKRIELAKAAEQNVQNGVHLDRRPGAGIAGDFSADYSVVNRLVNQNKVDNNGNKTNTILFYPTIGQKPRVTYFLDTHDGLGWTELDRETLEETLLDIVQKIADKKRFTDADFTAKIERELNSDAATISSVTLDKEGHFETRSRIYGQGSQIINKKPVRALYTNQIYYLSNSNEHAGHSITEEFNRKEQATQLNEEAFFCSFDDINEYGEKLTEGKVTNDVCCICGEPIDGWGNNPEPYHSGENGERCCDACNYKFVIPARLDQINRNK